MEAIALIQYQFMQPGNKLKIQLKNSYNFNRPPTLRQTYSTSSSIRFHSKPTDNKFSNAYLQRQEVTNRIYSTCKQSPQRDQQYRMRPQQPKNATIRIVQRPNSIPSTSSQLPRSERFSTKRLNLYFSQGPRSTKNAIFSELASNDVSAFSCKFKRSHSARVFQKYPMYEQMIKYREDSRQVKDKAKMISSKYVQKKLRLVPDAAEEEPRRISSQARGSKIFIYEKGIVIEGGP